jgi:hypothetical protein
MALLLVPAPSDIDTRQFASDVCRLLRVAEAEERYSDNYPPECRYFRCRTLGIEIVVCRADDASEFHDPHVFHIWFRTYGARIANSDFLDGVADLAARIFAISGHRVGRPLGHTVDAPIALYRKNPRPDPPYGAEVIEELLQRQR